MYEVLSKGMKYEVEKIIAVMSQWLFSQYSEMFYNESSHYVYSFSSNS